MHFPVTDAVILRPTLGELAAKRELAASVKVAATTADKYN
jgi:hypothetical protein